MFTERVAAGLNWSPAVTTPVVSGFISPVVSGFSRTSAQLDVSPSFSIGVVHHDVREWYAIGNVRTGGRASGVGSRRRLLTARIRKD